MASAAKVLSVGLGDLVSARNAALRTAGFEVVAAISIEDVFHECGPARFDIAIVGHAFSIPERAEFVRCIQGIFRLPVILIAEGEIFASIRSARRSDFRDPSSNRRKALPGRAVGSNGITQARPKAPLLSASSSSHLV
jgi:hypothetical protein